MSNDMIFATYKLATIAMVEGAVLLWMGMIYGFGIMMAGTIWQQLIALANETEEEDETERRETKASGKADAKAKGNHGKKRLTWENWNVEADCADHIIVKSKTSDRRRVAYK